MSSQWGIACPEVELLHAIDLAITKKNISSIEEMSDGARDCMKIWTRTLCADFISYMVISGCGVALLSEVLCMSRDGVADFIGRSSECSGALGSLIETSEDFENFIELLRFRQSAQAL